MSNTDTLSPAPSSCDDALPAKAVRRGFAGMTPDKKRRIASLGGQTAHRRGVAHQFTKEEARAAGKKGGYRVSQDRAHMVAIGRQGGLRRWRNHRTGGPTQT